MIKRSQIKKRRCKHEGCPNWPILGFDGYCNDHVSEELKEKKKTKGQIARNKAQQKAKTSLALHRVQNWQNRLNGQKTTIKPKIQKPIPKVAKKRLAELKIYKVLRAEFLKDRPLCEAKLEGCRKKATDIHHKRGRENGLLNEVQWWLPVCRNCHSEITTNSRMAIENGLSISRLSKPELNLNA